MSEINKIYNYLRKYGWVDEYVIFYNIIAEIEKTQKYTQLQKIIKKPSSLLLRDFIYEFKHLVTDNDNYYDEIRLFNCFTAIDSATGDL